MDFSALAGMDLSDLENVTLEDALDVNPGDVEVSTNLPGMTAVFHCTDAKLRPIAGKDGKDNMLFVDLVFPIKEVKACADPKRAPESFVGRKHTESFNIANEMGMAALVRTLCNIAGVDASDKEARVALGGTVAEVVKELAQGSHYFVSSLSVNKKNPDYTNMSRKDADFAPA